MNNISLNLIMTIVCCILLFIVIDRFFNNHNVEGFSERLGYQHRVRDIARCPTYQCLQKKEDECQRWCTEHVINAKDAGYCRYKCHEMTEDTIDSMIYQYQNFGDALYKFHERIKL